MNLSFLLIIRLKPHLLGLFLIICYIINRMKMVELEFGYEN